jgi:hypothetical protein
MTKNSTNDIKLNGEFRILKLVLNVRKLRGSDMDGFNLYGNQTTHWLSAKS